MTPTGGGKKRRTKETAKRHAKKKLVDTDAASEAEEIQSVIITPMSITDGEGYDKIIKRDKTTLKNSSRVSFILKIKILVRQLILNPIFCVRAGLS